MAVEIKRGEVYWVDWNPGRGSEQVGQRPAVIIQNDVGNRVSRVTIIAACSTAPVEKPFPFIVKVTAAESGFSDRDFHVHLGQIMTIDKSRLRDKYGELDDIIMAKVDDALKISLALR